MGRRGWIVLGRGICRRRRGGLRAQIRTTLFWKHRAKKSSPASYRIRRTGIDTLTSRTIRFRLQTLTDGVPGAHSSSDWPRMRTRPLRQRSGMASKPVRPPSDTANRHMYGQLSSSTLQPDRKRSRQARNWSRELVPVRGASQVPRHESSRMRLRVRLARSLPTLLRILSEFPQRQAQRLIAYPTYWTTRTRSLGMSRTSVRSSACRTSLETSFLTRRTRAIRSSCG